MTAIDGSAAVDLTTVSEDDLLDRLDAVERAITRANAFTCALDATGAAHIRVSDELLMLAEREELLARELGRRRTLCQPARCTPTWSDTVAYG